jgi:hypothetical protein
MKLRSFALALVLPVMVIAATACKDKDKGGGDGGASGAGSAGSSGSAAAGGSAGGSGSAAPEAKSAAPKDMTVDQFLTKAPPAACKTITSCKNDKVKVTATMPLMLVAGFGTMDKPDLQKDLKAIDTAMKGEKRWTLNEAECGTYATVSMKVLGVEGETLKAKVGKTVAYDATKAAACLEALGKAPEACATENKLAAEPKMKEMEAFDKELKPAMDAWLKPCEGVIDGMVDEGGACESDVECKGKGAKCKGGAKGGPAPKKDPKAAASAAPAAGKTCQGKK